MEQCVRSSDIHYIAVIIALAGSDQTLMSVRLHPAVL